MRFVSGSAGETLLIDNHDSFTHNLAQLLTAATGQPPHIVANDAMSWDALEPERYSRIVISPGPGRPQVATDLGLSADAIRHARVPMLGVCLGHQAIAHLHGGAIGQAPSQVHGLVDLVHHSCDELFEGLPSPFRAVRYHSLAVLELPECLQAIAWAQDGTIMALRHRARPVWGLQFHPESICSEHGDALIRKFIAVGNAHWRDERAPVPRPETSVEPPQDPLHASPPWRLHVASLETDVEPGDAFERLLGNRRNAVWLDACPGRGDGWPFACMADDSGPLAEIVRYTASERRVDVSTRGGEASFQEGIVAFLKRRLREQRISSPPLPFDFQAGYLGYFGYEAALDHQPARAAGSAEPDACWLFADRALVMQPGAGRAWLLCVEPAREEAPSAENQAWIARASSALRAPPALERTSRPAAGTGPLRLAWRHPARRYLDLIAQAQHYIRCGESYEICLTNQLEGHGEMNALEVYRALRRLNPAPFGAFMRFDDLAVLSSSPELFLSVSGSGSVESRPIKGTRSRDADPATDRQLAAALLASEKDRAENLMIVDLTRNDLNRVCTPGSVQVPMLFGVETFATVHQLVSTVQGQCRPGLDSLDCVAAAFPPGSMTGAPKKRTVALLESLEASPRGVYSGVLGYLSLGGAARLSVVIRTIVINGMHLSLGAGGAITALSDPEAELAEATLKSQGVLAALAAAGTEPVVSAIETLGALTQAYGARRSRNCS